MTRIALNEGCMCPVCMPPVLYIFQGLTADALNDVVRQMTERETERDYLFPIITTSPEPVTITALDPPRDSLASYLVGLLDPGWEA